MSDSNELRALQEAFAQALLNGEHVPGPGLVRERGLSARQRLNVYYHHTRIVQSEALGAIYPAISRLVGEEFFSNMAVLYGDRHPLDRGDLRTFGAHLAEFMARFEPLTALPYLPDVARLEWACHESLHGANTEAPAPNSTGARLRLAPHARLLRSPFPVAAIWEFALADHPADGPRLNLGNAEPSYLLVARPRLDVSVLALTVDDWRWLARFEKTAIAERDEAARVEYWVSQGILSARGEP